MNIKNHAYRFNYRQPRFSIRSGKSRSFILVLILAGFFYACAIEESADDENDFKPGYYHSMDYGPVLAESVRKDWPENSLVRKGLAIRLEHNVSMLFDTDLVHFSAGSKGGWLDISDTDYASYKGSGIAQIEGRQVFGSSEIAGWAKDGSFYGSREDGMGNLPHDWAHYKGYYRYGDQTVLSYSVGETMVLELPEAVRHEGVTAFVRNIHMESTDVAQKALLLEKRDSWSVVQSSDNGIILETEDAALAVLLAKDPGGARLMEGRDSRIELLIPESTGPQSVRVMIFEMDTPHDDLYSKFQELGKKSEMPDLEAMTHGGPAQWDTEITVSGKLSEKDSGYVLDRITIPFDNPWGSWMRLSGLDFFEDGTRAAVSTWNGDVWIVSGIDENLDNITWRRFASGMFYPMGVAIVNEEIYVTERSQLTRLRDLNGNGEADYYENFNNDGIVYPRAHTLDLIADSEGYFYFFKNGNRVPAGVPQHGALIRVSPDGSEREIFARGYRGGNTIGIDTDGMILAADQEGSWVPVDRIDVMRKGGFYGVRRHGGENIDEVPVGEFEVPVVWTAKSVNNSSGLLTYAGDKRWGPLSGQWILGSYGQTTLFSLLIEEIGDGLQGGIAQLPVESVSGLMRGRVSPADGQFYMVGLRGWQTLGNEDGSFERIRYAGGAVKQPKGLYVSTEGVRIEFTDPLNPVKAREIENYTIKRWEYLYSEQYGSPEYSLERPGEEGRDDVEVVSVTVSDNNKEIFLEIPDIRSVMQMKIGYRLLFEDGSWSENAVYHTINWLSSEETSEKPEWQQRIISGWLDDILAERTEADEEIADESAPEWYREGSLSFQRNCVSCHVAGGVAPVMEESEWAAGSYEAFIRILLHGKRGDRGVMTPFSWMDDEEIASIVSYLRSRFHDKDPVNASEVRQIRQFTEDRTELWTEEELNVFQE